jgi:hypothetical protein
MGGVLCFRRKLIAPAAVCLAAVLASPGMAATTASAAPAATGPTFTFTTFDVPNSVYTDILGINNASVMVGQYFDIEKGQTLGHGFIATGNQVTTVNVPGSVRTLLQSINDKGSAVGSWIQSLGDGEYVPHGFFRSTSGVVTRVDDPAAGSPVFAGSPPQLVGGFTEGVYGINDQGVLVGSFVDSGGVEHGFIYQHGQFTTVDNRKYAPSSSSGTELWGINNRGVIDGLGYSYPTIAQGLTLSPRTRGSEYSYFKYSYFTGTGDTGGYESNGGTWPQGINDRGAVVGHSNGWEFYGVFVGWERLHGKMFAISDPLANTTPGSNWGPGCGCFGGTAPAGINDQGTVTGIYFDDTGTGHGFIATPSP